MILLQIIVKKTRIGKAAYEEAAAEWVEMTTDKAEQDVEQGLKTLLDAIEKKTAAVHKNIPFEFVEGESVREISTSL